MKQALVLMMVMACSTGVALAAGKNLDIGQREYESNCVACHGVAGKGNGPVADVLKVLVPDLTEMSKKNGGVFPFARVYEAIDGRQQLQAHGTCDMPVWGNAYKAAASPDYDDYPHNAESFVRSRILALIDYLHRLQAK
jgi:mono/diheme cytochrome c family protein